MARARKRPNKNMRDRGLLTQLLGRPGRDATWRRILAWFIRARAELTVLTVLVTGHILLEANTDWSTEVVAITETMVIIGVSCLPFTRARMWAVISRHRVYACLVQTRTMTPDGKLPYLYWSSPSPVGERIRVWLPAGLSSSDLENNTEALAAACYASEARVDFNRKYTHLATIHIARRNPYGKQNLISPVLRRVMSWFGTNGHHPGNNGQFVPLPDRSTLPNATPPAEHPTVVGARKEAERRNHNGAGNGGKEHTKKNTTANEEPTPAPSSVGVGGMDVSDYV